MSVGITGPTMGSGTDWICGETTCRHINFSRRRQCSKCHRARSPSGKELDRERNSERSSRSSGGSQSRKNHSLGTEIGKAAAEKSRGLFSAEDWQCNKCANVNWARRQTCNICNAPRFTDVEERTGYGGGYNDRGIVEYKSREESDSEYDEFGRLKKRRKHSSGHQTKRDVENTDSKREHCSDSHKYRNKHNEESSRKNIKVVEEDEDEEEEDNESDLAKYDLFGDENVEEELILPRKNTTHSQKVDKGEPHQVENQSDRYSHGKDDRKRTHSSSRSLGGSSKRGSSSKERRQSRNRDRGDVDNSHRTRNLTSPNRTGSGNKYRKTHYKDNVENHRRSRKDSYSSSSSSSSSSSKSPPPSSSSSSSKSSHLSRSISHASSEDRHRRHC